MAGLIIGSLSSCSRSLITSSAVLVDSINSSSAPTLGTSTKDLIDSVASSFFNTSLLSGSRCTAVWAGVLAGELSKSVSGAGGDSGLFVLATDFSKQSSPSICREASSQSNTALVSASVSLMVSELLGRADAASSDRRRFDRAQFRDVAAEGDDGNEKA